MGLNEPELQGRMEGEQKQKQQTPTYTQCEGVGDSEKAQRQLPDEQSHREVANPSRPKQGGVSRRQEG
jgi:hypothetical protein